MDLTSVDMHALCIWFGLEQLLFLKSSLSLKFVAKLFFFGSTCHILVYTNFNVLLIYFQGIQQLFLEDQPGLFLVSAGAECVMLNKKIYKDLVNPNMAQNIKQQVGRKPCFFIWG